MRADVAKSLKKETIIPTGDLKLSTAYPQLYCPRCGSYEIGLRQFDGAEAIWGCLDCAASFALNFPRQRRF
jgi:transposase-like protein